MGEGKKGLSRFSRHSNRNPERQGNRPASAAAKRRGKLWLLFPALLLATLAAYQPAWHGGMLWDDDAHITPGALRTSEGLWRIWFDLGATQQYYPVVHSVFWFLFKLWGENTLGYHLFNIALHALSAFLLAVILRRLAVPGAFLAAAIFALHPVYVESVAWIAELKNTLSCALVLGSALAYLRFDDSRRKRCYALALVLFVAAALSKTVTATLPAALLVLFWWRRGSIGRRRDALPLAPFFALGIAAGLLTAWVERTLIGAYGAEFQFTPLERTLIAGRAIWFYLAKLFWPSNLIFIYPRWQVSQATWWQYLYPLGMLALLAGLWFARKRSRAPLAALLLFCGMLFPALGFFNAYPFRFSFVADHFQYLASIPIIALVAACLAIAARRRRLQQPRAAAATLALAAPLALLTWSQSRQYADAETLYRTTISRNHSCWMARNNLGILKLPGHAEEAIALFKEALWLKPDYAEAHNNLGHALETQGRIEEALAQYKEALRDDPDYFEAHSNIGVALLRLGRPEALEHLEVAVRLRPDSAGAHNNLGDLLHRLSRLEEARMQYEEALRLKPDFPEAHNSLGITLQELGRPGALAHFQEAARLKPESVEARNNLGNALRAQGQVDQAIAQYREALNLKPDNPEAHYNLGISYQVAGRPEEAIVQYKEALRLDPGCAEAHLNLGYSLQGLGRLEEAADEYRETLRLRPGDADAHFNLGNVLQGSGRVNEAVVQYREAIKFRTGDAEFHNNLGVALERLGRLKEALAEYEEALRLNQDSPDARANLTRILAILKKSQSNYAVTPHKQTTKSPSAYGS
jgi:tetratricopeptide (TPR) repeat protein